MFICVHVYACTYSIVPRLLPIELSMLFEYIFSFQLMCTHFNMLTYTETNHFTVFGYPFVSTVRFRGFYFDSLAYRSEVKVGLCDLTAFSFSFSLSLTQADTLAFSEIVQLSNVIT